MPPPLVQQLSRDDIECRRLIDVFRDEWRTNDQVSVCRCFVRIETGIIFELISDQFDLHPSLHEASVDPGDLWQIDWAHGPDGCCGEIIKNVIYSDFWPSIGLLLESNRILYCADYGTPYRVGPLLGRLGGMYQLTDLISFWDRIPLA